MLKGDVPKLPMPLFPFLSCVLFLVLGSGEGRDAGDDEIGGLLRALRDKVSGRHGTGFVIQTPRVDRNRRWRREDVIRWLCIVACTQLASKTVNV